MNKDSITTALTCERSNCRCRQRSGAVRYHCPSHEGSSPSLTITDYGHPYKLLFRCFSGCASKDVVAALKDRGLWPGPPARNNKAPGKRIVETYDYQQPDGQMLFQVVRYEPKAFRQRRPNGTGWIWDLEGVGRVPYRLPILMAADPSATVFISEGEKDADALSHAGLVATTGPMGAGFWLDSFAPYFADRQVVILPDADEAGHKHGQRVAASLYDVASQVKVVESPGVKDAAEWFGAGHTAAE